MKKKEKWQRIIDDLPSVTEGRGVRGELIDLRDYMGSHGLLWAREDAMGRLVLRATPHAERICSYCPGGIHRRSRYCEGIVAPAVVLRAARAAAEHMGLRIDHGVAYTTVRPGVRQTWRWSALEGDGRWVRNRMWVREDWCWVIPSATYRIATARCAAVRDGGVQQWRVRLGGREWREARAGLSRRGAESAVRDIVRRAREERERPQPLPTRTILRAMRRVARPGWGVVVSPASEGAEPAPAWQEDSTGEQYHPSDIRRPYLAEEAFALRRSRRETAALVSLLDSGRADGIWICASDSSRAGNCDAGTRTFAARHGLDVRRHYRAGEIRSLAGGDARQVRAAILAALRREAVEVRRGYAVLAEHGYIG